MENETTEKPNENECTGCKCLNNSEYKPKPAVYVEKIINMVLEINNAIDLAILERYKEILGQFTRDSKKMCNINLNPNYCTLDEFDQEKNRVLRLVLTMLRTIEQATNDMMVLLCNEQIGYFSIDVIGFLYDAMKSKLCYANLTIRWNEFISQTKEHLAYIDTNYKDKEELRKVKEELFAEGEHSFYKIFESWLWEFRDLKLQCAKILKLYLKIKEHRDYDNYIFDANMVEKCKIDQLYLYIKDHVDYVNSFYTQMHPFTERLFFVSGIDYLHECLDTMYNSSYFSAGLLDKKIKKYLQLMDKNDRNGIHGAKLLVWNKELQSRHHLVQECIRRFSGVCKVMRKEHLGENTDDIVFIEEENILRIQKRHDNIHEMTQSNFTDVPVKELKLHKVKINILIGITSILTLVNCALLYKILIK